MNVEAYPTIADVPVHADLAVVATPARWPGLKCDLPENENLLKFFSRLGFNA